MPEDTKFFCPGCKTQAIRNEETKRLSCPKCKKQPAGFIGTGYNLYTANLDPERKFPYDFPMDPKYYLHQDF